MVPPLITLEEHFISHHINGVVQRYEAFPDRSIPARLTDLGDGRIRDMDAGKVSLQVISHGPFNAPAGECRKANNQLAEAVRKQPKRFAGFAVLSMLEPEAAADELERTVKEHGFVGALVNNHAHGTFYDDEKYWATFERAEKLDVPIYLHPAFPGEDLQEHYQGNFSKQAAFSMGSAGWGWHTETGLHILRLFASGLFDRFPKLKIIIGHMGEMLPFAFDRILPQSKAWGPRQRDLKTVWDENIWHTTSGYFSLAPLACLLMTVKIDKIMYSVDYPFSLNDKGLRFVEEMQKSDLVNEEQLELICYKNAESLLRVKAEA